MRAMLTGDAYRSSATARQIRDADATLGRRHLGAWLGTGRKRVSPDQYGPGPRSPKPPWPPTAHTLCTAQRQGGYPMHHALGSVNRPPAAPARRRFRFCASSTAANVGIGSACFGLHRRAHDRSVGAEHAAVTSSRLQPLATAGALVEVLAGVLGHRLRGLHPARGAGEDRFEGDHGSRIGRPLLPRSVHRPTPRDHRQSVQALLNRARKRVVSGTSATAHAARKRMRRRDEEHLTWAAPRRPPPRRGPR